MLLLNIHLYFSYPAGHRLWRTIGELAATVSSLCQDTWAWMWLQILPVPGDGHLGLSWIQPVFSDKHQASTKHAWCCILGLDTIRHFRLNCLDLCFHGHVHPTFIAFALSVVLGYVHIHFWILHFSFLPIFFTKMLFVLFICKKRQMISSTFVIPFWEKL